MKETPSVGLRRHVLNGLALGSTVAVISTLQHFTASTHVALHVLYSRAYYVPILWAAACYGIPGGVLTGIVSASAALEFAGVGSVPAKAIDVAVMVLLGAAVGAVVRRERRRAYHYRTAAASLEHANRDLQESHEQARRADQVAALGGLAAGLAEEMRGPLSAVRGAVDILSSRPQQGSSDRELSEIASYELGRLESLVTGFFAFARPAVPHLREACLRDVVEEVRARIVVEAGRSAVSIDIEYEPFLPPIRIDPDQVAQLVRHLVRNAVQATARGGRVQVRVGRAAGAQVVEVIDEGPGIAREYEGRVFQPFFSTKERGVGLGLAIAHRIVDAHRGTIAVRRRAPAGTIVRVELPETPAAHRSNPAETEEGLGLKA